METPKRIIVVMLIRLGLAIILLAFVAYYVNLKENKFILIALFIITVHLLDIMDCALITQNRECRSILYQITDKIVDLITLGYFVFIIIPDVDPVHYEIIKYLWYFRLIGVILLALTGNKIWCVIFGNYVEIGILLSVFGWWQYEILVILLFFSKLVQELILHSNLDYFKFRNRIFGKL